MKQLKIFSFGLETLETRFPELGDIPSSNNIVDLLLQCDEHKLPWKKLLSYAIVVFNPLLAVLAACYKVSPLAFC